MEGKIILFDVLNATMSIIKEKHPSPLLPFRGALPLIEPWQEDLFREGTADKRYLEECEPWIQQALIKAQRIRDIEDGFREYLYINGLSQRYMEMDGKQKANEIARFLAANSLTTDALIIKGKNIPNG